MRLSKGHRREGAQGPNWRPRQEEVPGAVGPDRGAVLLLDPEAHSLEARGRALLFRQQCDSPDLRHDGLALPGAPRRGLLLVHCL